MNKILLKLADEVGEVLLARKILLATAESCTGGWVSQIVTAVAGSSAWFERGFVTYADAAKQEMLGVNEQTLRQHGAVSEATAIEMAEGALRFSHAHVALAVTGIAGPTGGNAEKPVGLVYLAWSSLQLPSKCRKLHFNGERDEIRHQAVESALTGLQEYVLSLPVK